MISLSALLDKPLFKIIPILGILLASLLVVYSVRQSSDQQEITNQQTQETFDPNEPELHVLGSSDGFVGGVISQTSLQEPKVAIEGRNLSNGEVTVDIYKATTDEIINYLVYDDDGYQINPTVDVSGREKIASINTNLTGSGYWLNSGTITLPISGVGIWVINATQGDVSDQMFLVRSKVTTLLKEGDNQYVAWTQDLETKRSVDTGQIKLYTLNNSAVQIATAVIESDGTTTIPLTGNIDIGVVESRDSTAILPIRLRYLNYGYSPYNDFSPKEIYTNSFLFTDRPLYKPGDTIYFKVIARDDDDAKYSIPTGTARAILYKDSQDQPLFEQFLPITADGTVHGEFTLPEDVSTGGYSLAVNFNDNNQTWLPWGRPSNSSRYIRVEHFRKPEYTISIDSTQEGYVSGDKATVIVNGEYFFGEPITKGSVSYTVTSADYYDYSYYADITARLSNNYWYGRWYGKQITSGSAQFDQTGQALIELDTTIPDQETKSKVYTIEATYKDASGDQVVDTKNILISRGEFGLYQKDYSYSHQAGDQVTMSVVAVSKTGASVANKQLTATLKRHDWVRYEKEYDTKDPTITRSGYEYREVIDELPNLSATTNEDGEATFSFTADKKGTYRLKITATDNRGNTITQEVSAWVREPGEPFYTYQKYDSGLTISPDQQQYSHTDTAAFTIHSEVPDRDVFLSFDRAYMHRYQVINIRGNTQTITIDLEESDMPNIFAKVASFAPDGFDTDRAELTVSTNPKKLITSITPDRDTYGPGDTVELTIETTDYSGNPVSADTAVWAVDKAIFELVSQDDRDIVENFWYTRWDNTQETHSLQNIQANPAEMGGGCFTAETQILMSDGSTKAIQDVRPGDRVLTRESEYSPKLVQAEVTDTHQHTANGYFIINQTLNVTPEHRMWINDMWQEAYYIEQGDILLDTEGDEIIVESIEWQAGSYEVYNLEIDTYQTYFAGGVWVHNQKGGGGGRSIFKDTAYWNPSVRTDNNGRATVTFTLPDNLTTWAVSAIAATRDTSVGSAAEEIVVRKNVVVRPSLPNILRIGDENTITTYVHNFTDNDQSFLLGAEFDAGTISANGPETITVPAKQTATATWTIVPEQETDTAQLAFSAVAQGRDDLSDTITREIPVWTYGYWKKYGEVGTGEVSFDIALSEGSDPDESFVRVALSPSLLGTLPTAMNYLVQYPYGCVEQTTSRFVPGVIALSNPELFASAVEGKDIDDMLNEGATRLGNLQNSSGGWSWWSYNDTNPYITSYVIEYLYQAQLLGADVDPSILDNAKRYLQNSINNDKLSKEEKVAILYALSILEMDEGNTPATIDDSYSPDIVALAVLHNTRIGITDPDKSGVTLLLKKAQNTKAEGYIYWPAGKQEFFGSKEASTALAIRALSAANADQETLSAATRYLLASRKSEYWANSFATAQVIQAVVDNAKNTSELSGSYVYNLSIDNRPTTTGTVTDYKTIIDEVIIPGTDINQGGSTLSITKSSEEGQIYSSVITEEYHTDTQAVAESSGLIVVRDYKNADGTNTIRMGDTVDVILKIRNLSENESRYAVLEDQLPSGFVPINTAFENINAAERARRNYNISALEFTKNGVIVGINNLGSRDFTYTYKARVVTQGTFHAPPATASLMYAPEISGYSDAHTITITESSSSIYPEKPTNDFNSATRTRDYSDNLKLSDNTRIYIQGGILLAVCLVILAVTFRKRLPLPLREKLSQIIETIKSRIWKK